MLVDTDIEGDGMKPNEFLEYLWDRPQTNALARALAQVFVERGRFDLIPVPVRTSEHKPVTS
jgi:hypothetical protein